LDANSISNWVNESQVNVTTDVNPQISDIPEMTTASGPNATPINVSAIPNSTPYSLPFNTPPVTSEPATQQHVTPGLSLPAVSNLVSCIRTVYSAAASVVSSSFSISNANNTSVSHPPAATNTFNSQHADVSVPVATSGQQLLAPNHESCRC
jgi:hypothetical protein